jgi:Uma2 family endonuclease
MQRTIFTSADLELLPDDGTRYEIIDGELIMTRQPHWEHQTVCGYIFGELRQWIKAGGYGRVSLAPGVIFGDTDNVVPDVAWISPARFAALLDSAGHLTGAPELVVEVLSPGLQNEQRDRETKRKLYEVRGVQEYWVVDWRIQQIEVYRREQAILRLTATLFANDTLTTPLLPGFACPIMRIFS